MTALTCPVCLGDGMTPGSYDLDCAACDVAEQRVKLAAHIELLGPMDLVDRDWAAYQFALSRPVAQEPVAYLRFRAAQQWSGVGGHDIEHSEWLETCQQHEVGDDKLPAFPVFAAPVAAPLPESASASPSGNVVVEKAILRLREAHDEYLVRSHLTRVSQELSAAKLALYAAVTATKE